MMREDTMIFLIGMLLSAAVILPTGNAIAESAAGNAGATPWWWGALITPLLTGIFGVLVAYIAIYFDRKKTSNQELIKKRIEVYDDMAPKLNDLLCFFRIWGDWKGLPPPMMIQRKRELDRAIYVYGRLFSQATFDKYQEFIHTCFVTFVQVGKNAVLRADRVRLQREWENGWQSAWDECFVDPTRLYIVDGKRIAAVVDGEIVATKYNELMILLASEIGVRQGFLARWHNKRRASRKRRPPAQAAQRDA